LNSDAFEMDMSEEPESAVGTSSSSSRSLPRSLLSLEQPGIPPSSILWGHASDNGDIFLTGHDTEAAGHDDNEEDEEEVNLVETVNQDSLQKQHSTFDADCFQVISTLEASSSSSSAGGVCEENPCLGYVLVPGTNERLCDQPVVS
jgi:hypothetical protein